MSSERRLRVAILGTRGIPARYGGFETFAEELSVRLVERGVDVTVYCAADAEPRPSMYRGINLAYVPATECGPLTTVLFDLRSLWRARKGFDVVYMLGYGAAPFCVIPRFSGSRVWLNVDGVEWARAKWGRMARMYFKLMETVSLWAPNLVVADAAAIRDHLRVRHASRKEIVVIPYGAPVVQVRPDAAVLEEWRLEAEGYYLIVCRLEPENHVREMIEGLIQSHSKKLLVVLGNHLSGTKYVADLRGLTDPRVRFLGTVYDQSKLQALRYHAFAYCHGHSVGGTNPSLLEALGCGNAVIAHDNPFNHEVVRDAATYFRDSKDFARCVGDVERDPSARATMKARAIEIVRADYTWDGITNEYLSLLESGQEGHVRASS